MTKMTKEQRDAAIEATKGRIAVLSEARKLRVADKAAKAQDNVYAFCAFASTNAFAALVVDWSLDLEDIFKRCDKTLKRFIEVTDCLMSETFALRNANDQKRYVFNLMNTMLNSAKREVVVTKNDLKGTTTKIENAPDYVVVSPRIMANSTSDRQGGIAVYVCEMLGFLKREKIAGRYEYKIDLNRKVTRKVAKIVASA